MSDFGIVTILCNLMTESIVRPVKAKPFSLFEIKRSVESKVSGILLEINAIMI